MQSSFNFHLKHKFQKKLFANFKKCFFDLKDYDPEEDFYGDERDLVLDNGVLPGLKNQRRTAGGRGARAG